MIGDGKKGNIYLQIDYSEIGSKRCQWKTLTSVENNWKRIINGNFNPNQVAVYRDMRWGTINITDAPSQ